MPKTTDYYETLGVQRTADEKTIKAAYRKLARKWHPDVNSGDATAEAKFKEISEAFAVLSDPKKRAQYDRGGHAAFGSDFDPFAGTGFSPGGQGGAHGFNVPDLSDLFDMFGLGGSQAGQGRRRAARGRDLEMRLDVPFMDAVQGTTLTLKIPRLIGCDRCHGQDPRCVVCGGRGMKRIEDKVRVRIPAGIEEGTRVRVSGKGDAGRGGGPAGDAYLKIHVLTHPLFRREGLDLVVEIPVGIVGATLGGTVKVPTLDGHAEINLPAGTRSGVRMRLKGRGVKKTDGTTGDLYAVIQIHPPKKLDERSKTLLEEFDKLNPS